MYYNTNDYKTCNKDLYFTSHEEYYAHFKAVGKHQGRITDRRTLINHNDFVAEIMIFIPYIYYLWSNHLLTMDPENPVSTYKGMRPFYYFLSDELYKERNDKRISRNNVCLDYCNISPKNKTKYIDNYDETYWKPPPYKEIYQNLEYVYDKPLLVLCVKDPKNFISLFSDNYHVICVGNGPNSIDINDYEACLPIYANCDNFVSDNANHNALAAFFAKKMCIIGKKMPYKQCNGAEVTICRDNNELFVKAYEMFE